jgi:hypothetical protein
MLAVGALDCRADLPPGAMRGNGAGRAVNSKELCAQLVELERAAAHCGALLADAPPELVERVVAAFAPAPAARGP